MKAVPGFDMTGFVSPAGATPGNGGSGYGEMPNWLGATDSLPDRAMTPAPASTTQGAAIGPT